MVPLTALKEVSPQAIYQSLINIFKLAEAEKALAYLKY
jgi:hypothetical protein